MNHARTSELMLAALAEGEGGSGGGAAGSGGGSGGDAGRAEKGSGDGSGTGGSGGDGAGKERGGSSGDKDIERRLESQPQWLQALVRELRDDSEANASKHRAAEARNAALLEAIGSALGLTKTDAKDPDKLTADLASAGERIRRLETELAVHTHAADAGGDPAALLDSRSFVDSLAGLDLAASDYPARIKDKVKSAVEANPRLGTPGPTGATRPARSGIGQERPGTATTATGVAAGRELRQARRRTRSGQQTTTTAQKGA